jgi:homospermidine synthase
MTRRDIFDQWSNAADGLDRSDPWQFCNFLVS